MRWVCFLSQEAEADRQQTVLRAVLAAAAKLPWTLHQLRAGGLPATVMRLQQGAPSVAAAADVVARLWRRLECPFLPTTPNGYSVSTATSCEED